MRKSILLYALVILVASAPALAGEGHKCTASTQDCLNMMAKSLKNRGLIGVDGEWDESGAGFRVLSYIDGSNAEASGVHIGDVLLAINGVAINDKEGSKADSPNRKPGSVASVKLMRDGSEVDLTVELTALSDEMIAKWVGEHMLEHAEVEIASAD